MDIGLAVIGAYLLGSVSFAIVVSKLMRLPDPRSYGSKNPGATNVLRTGSRAAAVVTLAGDAVKGWLAVWLALLYVPEAAPYAALAVFLGHLFPLYHRFQGGKGVATAAGVLFGIDWRLGLGIQRGAQLLVRPDAARHDKAREAIGLQRAYALRHQHLDHRVHECARDVGMRTGIGLLREHEHCSF